MSKVKGSYVVVTVNGANFGHWVDVEAKMAIKTIALDADGRPAAGGTLDDHAPANVDWTPAKPGAYIRSSAHAPVGDAARAFMERSAPIIERHKQPPSPAVERASDAWGCRAKTFDGERVGPSPYRILRPRRPGGAA